MSFLTRDAHSNHIENFLKLCIPGPHPPILPTISPSIYVLSKNTVQVTLFHSLGESGLGKERFSTWWKDIDRGRPGCWARKAPLTCKFL